jgi:hypothetical protein
LPVCISLSDDDSSIYIERDHGHQVIFFWRTALVVLMA